MTGKPSALVLLLPGLGDAFTATPIFEGLYREGYDVDAVTMLSPVTEYLTSTDFFRSVIEVRLLERWNGQILRTIIELFRHRYDIGILPFPATRWQYSLLAFCVRAKRIYMHRYGGLSSFLCWLRRACTIDLRGGHRISENRRLAGAIGLPGHEPLRYFVPTVWRAKRTGNVLGIQPGSMTYKGNDVRRWPITGFLEVAKRAIARGRRVRFYIGPNESDLLESLNALRGDGLEIIQIPLSDAARNLSSCEVFLGNDAGMTHLAAALGVKAVAIYTMTNPIRSAALGRTIIIDQAVCPPCHDEGSKDFSCVLNLQYMCTKVIRVDDVDAAVERAFLSEIPEITPIDESPFRLYRTNRNPSPQ